jgi:hypothetical protein
MNFDRPTPDLAGLSEDELAEIDAALPDVDDGAKPLARGGIKSSKTLPPRNRQGLSGRQE